MIALFLSSFPERAVIPRLFSHLLSRFPLPRETDELASAHFLSVAGPRTVKTFDRSLNVSPRHARCRRVVQVREGGRDEKDRLPTSSIVMRIIERVRFLSHQEPLSSHHPRSDAPSTLRKTMLPRTCSVRYFIYFLQRYLLSPLANPDLSPLGRPR